MKRTARKIAIVLFIFMVPTLLIPGSPQLMPEAFAENANFNDWQQPPDNNGNDSNTTDSSIMNILDKVKEKAEKGLSDTNVEVDKEQIKQEIQENVRNIEDNVLLNSNFLVQRLQRAGEETRKIIEGWDPQTGVETLENRLQELADREGVTIHIEETYDVSFVYEGKTYSTSAVAEQLDIQPLVGKEYVPDSSTATVLSKGHPEIVFGIGGLAVGFLAAMFIFRKRKSAPAASITEKEIKDEE